MASTLTSSRISDIPWKHLLRASLRECTYLPDPVARSYMRGYVVDRYRRVSESTSRPQNQKLQQARHGLSVLRRANEGYQGPLEKVLFLSYGRIGKRRHELLNEFLKPPVPKDTEAVKALIAQPAQYDDGWEPPEIVMDLVKSQMHNGVVMTSRRRPRLTKLEPVIPKKNSWDRPVPLVRRRNIRKKWYQTTLDCLYPPLPERELGILDGLLARTIPWEPVKRRKIPSTASSSRPTTDDAILDFLVDGPQKSHTFRKYVLGRPHIFTSRFMHRQWRRISALVPRMYRSPYSDKMQFSWDTPKPVPSVNSYVLPEADLDAIFGEAKASVQRRKSNAAPQL
ncbi:uncharacterized protein N7469_002505 [Penicillium citrinum]|uniref:LYR motif-containing protein Cup1-like N-terminal domain-containing protein n=1 Tax=Penicillium citrinum TaxID=5077 RepID=A0A9W9PAL1_PENCI|nr:uncharacterized protein N7469_002505 [Penicillium citrinum]KAJ5240914.1 hypothetical protein N7469_002505 [Penicillium citrinum]